MVNYSHAQDGGIIPKEQMQAFCDGSAKSFLNELESINRFKIQAVKDLSQHVSDSKNVDDVIRQFMDIQNRYVESLQEIEMELGKREKRTDQLKDVILGQTNFLESVSNGQRSANVYSLADDDLTKVTTTRTIRQSSNNPVLFDIKQFVQSYKLETPEQNLKSAWWPKFQSISTDSVKLNCLKILSENANTIPASLKPDVILSLYNKNAPRTLKLLEDRSDSEIKKIYGCLDRQILTKNCDKFLAPNETLTELRNKLINEEENLSKDFKLVSSSDEFKQLVADRKTNKLKKETLQDSLKLIKEQLNNEGHLHKDASFAALRNERDSATDYTQTEKRFNILQDAIAGQSSLFFILFDDKIFADPDKFDSDYEFQKRVDIQVDLTKQVEAEFKKSCIDAVITDETQQKCYKLLEMSVDKVEKMKNNFITRNQNQISTIRETMSDPAFNAIEDLKKLFVHTYLKNCRSDVVTSKDMLITCEARENDHTVIKNLFNNTYNVVGKLNESLGNTKTITPEVRAVFQNACLSINDDNAPILNRDLCNHFRPNGTYDQKERKALDRKVMAMNRAEKEERENYIEYDAKSRNGLRKTPKQSWGTIIGRGIVPVLPYAINNGMGLYQNKMQTEHLLNTGLMQKQYLHNLNYSWQYPINSYTNPFLFGTNNGQLHTFPNFGANTLTPSTGTGITNAFNFGN